MAYEYRFLKSASIEYENIIQYLLKASGKSSAKAFVNEFHHQVELICKNPELYSLSRFPEIAALGYRLALVNNYAFLYFFRNNIVYVAHIFHQRQDYAKLL